MPLSRPRRIFRSALPRIPLTGAVVFALLAAGVALAAAMMPWRAGDAPPAKPPAGSETLRAPPAQVAVVDSGTLRLQDRVVLLQGVDPPPRGSTCWSRDGAGFECAAAATNALAAMVQEVPVACRLGGQDRMGRALAVCEAHGTELNRAVVAAGWARADRTVPLLKSAEDDARTAGRGLWGVNRAGP